MLKLGSLVVRTLFENVGSLSKYSLQVKYGIASVIESFKFACICIPVISYRSCNVLPDCIQCTGTGASMSRQYLHTVQ